MRMRPCAQRDYLPEEYDRKRTIATEQALPEKHSMDSLTRLERTIADRATASAETSYVAKLNAKGLETIAKKLGEEATETVIAALTQSRDDLVSESADLVFHLLVLLHAKGVSLAEVMAELDRREGTSGLVEKASRSQ
jgi:phosphoribosyl-ATP pyrophosphohydrolase